jgi:hypothetical protein
MMVLWLEGYGPPFMSSDLTASLYYLFELFEKHVAGK